MRRSTGIVFLVLVFVAVLRGGDETAQGVLDRMKEKYDQVQDMQLKFIQKSTFELSRIEQETEGTLFLKKQNKYRIETNGQTIVTDGVTVWSYNPTAKQVLIDKFKLDENSVTPERILGGAPDDFTTSLLGREKVGKVDTYILKLIPRNEQSVIKSMKLWVDANTWLIKKTELSDLNGKLTLYTVVEAKVNGGLSDSRFSFQAPEGTDVVDLR
jgi:outer membrane lipoprotein carrier protein